jgi:hypothetical protein
MLYAIKAGIDQTNDLLKAVAHADLDCERMVRGFTETVVLAQSSETAADLERTLRSKYIGRFKGDWLVVQPLTAAQWDELLES